MDTEMEKLFLTWHRHINSAHYSSSPALIPEQPPRIVDLVFWRVTETHRPVHHVEGHKGQGKVHQVEVVDAVADSEEAAGLWCVTRRGLDWGCVSVGVVFLVVEVVNLEDSFRMALKLKVYKKDAKEMLIKSEPKMYGVEISLPTTHDYICQSVLF